jgi:hypothetical protein
MLRCEQLRNHSCRAARVISGPNGRGYGAKRVAESTAHAAMGYVKPERLRLTRYEERESYVKSKSPNAHSACASAPGTAAGA